MFKKSNQEFQKVKPRVPSYASYMVAYKIVKRGKPLLEAEFVKDCMLKVAEIVFPA